MSPSELVPPEPESRDRAPGERRRVNLDHPHSIETELLVEDLTWHAAGDPRLAIALLQPRIARELESRRVAWAA